ncbi:MAG: hypothetical protein ACI8X3_001814 [Saprospiraceae bacterium]|jgi:hypothetical protein
MLMNKIKLLLVVFIASFTGAIAQESYTYITDRKFFGPNDLIGYDFRPDAMEIKGVTEKKLSPGEYSFGISRSNLYVDGGDIKGVYSVNNINPTEYGYKLLLMNARDPTIQGHLKVILNKRAQVEALVFKRSNKEAEIIFFQSPITEKLYNQEEAYFTDTYDLSMEEQDSIWGKKIYPFLRIHHEEGGVQERLQIADSTSIEFVEKITIIEKKKKKKKKKGNQREETEEVVIIEEMKEAEGLEEDLGAVPPIEAAESIEEAIKEEQKEEVKIKIVKEYFINIRTILTFEDGTVEDTSEEIPIKKKFTLFETTANGDPTIEPYELEISPKKGASITMRLTKNKTISSIHIEGKSYLMRGH